MNEMETRGYSLTATEAQRPPNDPSPLKLAQDHHAAAIDRMAGAVQDIIVRLDDYLFSSDAAVNPGGPTQERSSVDAIAWFDQLTAHVVDLTDRLRDANDRLVI